MGGISESRAKLPPRDGYWACGVFRKVLVIFLFQMLRVVSNQPTVVRLRKQFGPNRFNVVVQKMQESHFEIVSETEIQVIRQNVDPRE